MFIVKTCQNAYNSYSVDGWAKVSFSPLNSDPVKSTDANSQTLEQQGALSYSSASTCLSL